MLFQTMSKRNSYSMAQPPSDGGIAPAAASLSVTESASVTELAERYGAQRSPVSLVGLTIASRTRSG